VSKPRARENDLDTRASSLQGVAECNMIAFREIHRPSIRLNLRLRTAVVRRFNSTVRTVAGSAGDGNICKGAAQRYTTYTGRIFFVRGGRPAWSPPNK
jgi:hypothetical protein